MDLYYCARDGDVQGCRRYLEAGADPNFQNVECKNLTPLYIATYNGHHDCMELLLNHRFQTNIDIKTSDGYFPLRYTITCCDI